LNGLYRPVFAPRGNAAPSSLNARPGPCRAGPVEGDVLLLGGHVPQLDRPVVTAGGQRLAVGAERHGIDRVRVPLEGGALLLGGPVPQLDGRGGTGGGDGLAVGAERHGIDNARVPLRGRRAAARWPRPTA